VGGISRTVNYKGNRIDIGGHRFFSKSEIIMNWWKKILALQEDLHSEQEDVFLVRSRLSRIFFLRKFFDYPIKLDFSTLKKLGLKRVIKIGLSYAKVCLFPIKDEENLEDFFTNRFGKELYQTFFKDYTEKVWGVECSKINADWGSQRIKGLSISQAIWHFLKNLFKRQNDVEQKDTETSLIERFLYPKYGPGQLWEKVAKIVQEKGGKICKNALVNKIEWENNSISQVECQTPRGNKKFTADYFFSTMPVKELIAAMGQSVPNNVKKVANRLMYRDFITVGLLLKKLQISDANNELIKDNWIYVQERDVKVGRLQIFNNWSPYLVKNSDLVWLGMEYFCNHGDELWSLVDSDMQKFAISELEKIGVIDSSDVVDATVIRMPKTYPAYFGSYQNFDVIRNFTDKFENLFLIGRNGMHRYNNMDHSMLTAITAVNNIRDGIITKDNIWNVNTEKEYHEGK
ncbi:MAG: NAD(P)/FAD-dependent oxidoreductase, partial [Candidatus Cloacimonadota bacterium]|nr:NAD(P)/FAD-dependent oxidoreductase [Candidatus Cloacimonadota bacterium]